MAVNLIERFLQYIDKMRRWMWLPSSGESGFVSDEAIRSEIAQQVVRSQVRMGVLARKLYGGLITVSQWEAAIAVELRNAHRAYAIFGAGGRSNMTAQSWGRLGGHLRDEYKWLHIFAGQIADGSVSEAQALSRLKQYAAASEQAYTREKLSSSGKLEWKNLPVLNQIPRDGGTQCHGSCKCEIVEREDGLHWVQNPAEHCIDCSTLAASGPYRPGKL